MKTLYENENEYVMKRDYAFFFIATFHDCNQIILRETDISREIDWWQNQCVRMNSFDEDECKSLLSFSFV